MKYSESTKAFYFNENTQAPSDCIDITDEQWLHAIGSIADGGSVMVEGGQLIIENQVEDKASPVATQVTYTGRSNE
ncbi:hypothetical protein E0H77_12495 [Acinetobacter sp. ANC 4633]|uniref:hypothetical protein n=1 Tax=Acinetobacter sp. ANC 4633 TaxID=2529845 RepID=UPI001039109D|nr:hypothetical protein [Acinetobacter sp. ANC 4633]TCB23935.1 hypothetical protein E0H77_12495 [Acinetobacter sp. ANC 4633]